MPDLVRLSLSIEKPLYDRLESLISDNGYANRSEFVRDMIRDKLVEREWDQNRETIGTLTLIYNHTMRKLSEKLTDIQHEFHDSVMVTTHVHLDHDLCVEVILLKGLSKDIQSAAKQLRQQKGVLHANLSFSSTGGELS